MGSRCGEGQEKLTTSLSSQGRHWRRLIEQGIPISVLMEANKWLFAKPFGMAAQAYNENGSPRILRGAFHKEIVFNSKTVETPLPKLHKWQDPLWDGYLQQDGNLIRAYMQGF